MGDNKLEKEIKNKHDFAKEFSGVNVRLIKERLSKGYSIEEAFTSLRRTNRDE